MELRALLISYGYVLLVILVAEGLGRQGRLSPVGARRLVHIGVGMWVWLAFGLFHSPWWAVAVPVSFVPINFLGRRAQLASYERADSGSWGTVLFPVAIALLLLLFWDQPRHALTGVMALTWGDPAAAWVGRRWGERAYRLPWGSGKTWEGTAAMALVSSIATALTLALGAGLTWQVALGTGCLLGVVAAVAEACGRNGSDNLWIPVAVALADVYLAGHAPGPVASRLAVALYLAFLVGWAGYRRRSLAPSGVLGAVLVGTPVFGLGGLPAAAALIFFFLSSSLLSHAFSGRKAALERNYEKGSARDLGQALANGGVAAVLVTAGFVAHSNALMAGAMGALAAANADTWATEIGGALGGTPRLLTTGREAPPGTSGAVSGQGLAAAALGAVSVGVVGAAFLMAEGRRQELGPGLLNWLLAVGAGGFIGSLVDSLLGATVQAGYWCPHCQQHTERTVHHCGAPTKLSKGWPWLTNDVVNLAATCSGGFLACVLLS